MECSDKIDIDGYDCDRIKLHTEKIVTARKRHTCHECGRTIERGEKYERVAFLMDGKWHLRKTCEDCMSMSDQFFGVIYREVGDEIECLKIIPGGRAWICKEFGENLETEDNATN